MEESESVRVNFGRPMPVFPLDAVAILPQQILELHVFEPRYRQMMSDILDGPGQIAVGVFEGDDWRADYEGSPPLRSSMCVAHVIDHQSLPDGRYNVRLQGICRARMTEEVEPEPGMLYRRVMLNPIDVGEQAAPPDIDRLRDWIGGELAAGPLRQMSHAAQVLEFVRDDRVPTPALLELVSHALITDGAVRYRLLSEPDLATRAQILQRTLQDMHRLISLVQSRDRESWPKGLSWN